MTLLTEMTFPARPKLGQQELPNLKTPAFFQATGLLDRIGNTPLIPIHRIPCKEGVFA